MLLALKIEERTISTGFGLWKRQERGFCPKDSRKKHRLSKALILAK